MCYNIAMEIHPKLGEIRKAKELGYKGHTTYIWRSCASCGKASWVVTRKGLPLYNLCPSCSHKGLHPAEETKKKMSAYLGGKRYNWKGGCKKTSHGYIIVRLYPDDFFYSMCQSNGYVLEHRLVMAKHLGRCLHLWELVHHKKGVAKDDNRIEGLQLVTDDRHKQITILENRINYLEQRMTLLETENVALKAEHRQNQVAC